MGRGGGAEVNTKFKRSQDDILVVVEERRPKQLISAGVNKWAGRLLFNLSYDKDILRC